MKKRREERKGCTKRNRKRERERDREREAFIASKNNFTVLHCRSVTVSVTVTVYSVTEKGMNKEREREACIASKNNFTILHCRSVTVSVK